MTSGRLGIAAALAACLVIPGGALVLLGYFIAKRIRLINKRRKRHPKCPDCGSPGERNERFDAYFCPKCDVWLERPCDDVTCAECRGRPERPWWRRCLIPASFPGRPLQTA